LILQFQKTKKPERFNVSIVKETTGEVIVFDRREISFTRLERINMKLKDQKEILENLYIPFFYGLDSDDNSRRKILEIVVVSKSEAETRSWKLYRDDQEIKEGIEQEVSTAKEEGKIFVRFRVDEVDEEINKLKLIVSGGEAELNVNTINPKENIDFFIILDPNRLESEAIKLNIETDDNLVRKEYILIPLLNSHGQSGTGEKKCLVCFEDGESEYRVEMSTKLGSEVQRVVKIKNNGDVPRKILLAKPRENSEGVIIRAIRPSTLEGNGIGEIILVFDAKDNAVEKSDYIEFYASEDDQIDEKDEKLVLTVETNIETPSAFEKITRLVGAGLILMAIGFLLGWFIHWQKVRPKTKAMSKLLPSLRKSIDDLDKLPKSTTDQIKPTLPMELEYLADGLHKYLNILIDLGREGIGAAKKPAKKLSQYSEGELDQIIKKLRKIAVEGGGGGSEGSEFIRRLADILPPSKKDNFGFVPPYTELEINDSQIIKRVEALKREDNLMEEFLDQSIKAFHRGDVARAKRSEKRSAIGEQFGYVHQLIRYLRNDADHRDATIKTAQEQLVQHKGQVGKLQQTLKTWRQCIQDNFPDIPNQSGSTVKDNLGWLKENRQQVREQLRLRSEEKRNLLETLEQVNQALHFQVETEDLVHADGAVLTDSLQFLKHKEPLLPNYVVHFRDMAQSMAEDLTQLRTKLAGHSDFRKRLDIAVHGPNQNSGPAGVVKTIGAEGNHDRFIAVLGLEHPQQLRDLEKSLFFRKLVRPLLMPSVNAFFQLYLYKDIRHNGVAVIDDFRADNLDVTVLERVHAILVGQMQLMFDMELINTRLFVDRYDDGKHERAHEPTLIKLPRLGKKYRAMLDSLEPNVVYDLSEVGYRSASLAVDVKPKLLSHT
jgi:hypothetical protein